ncbi:MAG: glycoside hydrolase family 2, partial [bacterium]|nr:glycoside hydrolase family 2 [bacterium]
KSRFRHLLILFLLTTLLPSCKKESTDNQPPKEPQSIVRSDTIALEKEWYIQSSAKCSKSGAAISSPDFTPQGWYGTPVPSTVLAALVRNNIYKDIYFAKNLAKIPTQQFNHSWWYRKEFSISPDSKASTVRLLFEGINYSANVWLNGKKLADADKLKGSFRIFEMDVTQHIRKGKATKNILAVEVFPPKPGDFTIGFVDWNPEPPDKSMGLWRGVKLRVSGEVSLNHIFVQTKVNLHTLQQASLTITAQLVNHTPREVSGIVKGKIETINIEQPFRLKPSEQKTITFSPRRYHRLNMENPRLWWPNNLGQPHLYRLDLTAVVGKHISHHQQVIFGIREVSDYLNELGHRGYKINGKEILIRGGGW